MRKSLEAVGLSAALIFSGAACKSNDNKVSEKTLSRYKTEATAKVVNEALLYAHPNDIQHPIGRVAVGEQANIVCFFSSSTLAMDSIKYIAGEQTGFSFIGHRNPDHTYVADFDPDLQGGNGIRDCIKGQDFNTQG